MWVCWGKPRTYNKGEQWVLGWRLLSAKCPRLKNVYKSNGRCLKKFKFNNKGNNRGEQLRSSVYTLHKTVCVRLFRHSNRGLITKGTIGSPVGKRPPVCQTCTKHMRGVAKMLEYKQKRNNGRTPFAGVYKFVCVCVCACAIIFSHFSTLLASMKSIAKLL